MAPFRLQCWGDSVELSLFATLSAVFVYAGTLPATFFKSGSRKTLGWLIACIPFFLLPVCLALGFVGVLPGAPSSGGTLHPAAILVASWLGLGAALLIRWSVSAHSEPVPLWHQEQHQLPTTLVTHGPYRYVRHPFYSAYLMLFLSVLISVPHWATLFLFLWALLAIGYTARMEERVLCAVDHGAQYKGYMETTGRFLPKISSVFKKDVQ